MSVCETVKIQAEDGKPLLKKLAPGASPQLFQQEAKGLRALRDSGCVKVPKVIDATSEYLLLEYIPTENPTEKFWIQLGQNLAKLHQSKVHQLGLDTDNFIGLTPQKNTPYKIYDESKDWLDFFWEYRIEFQLSLLKKKKAPQELFTAFAKSKDLIFKKLDVAAEEPCLLHGDLWKGNIICSTNQQPYLIDPSIYYGHREADLAMTQLFGNFHYVFYEAYQKVYPLKPGWPDRLKIYQLYHLLNHWNLFGDSYADPVYSSLKKLSH